MKMDVNVSLPKAAIAAVAVFAIVLVVLLAWIGSEEHYGNCLEKAALEHPVPAATAGGAGLAQSARNAAISGCSRWP